MTIPRWNPPITLSRQEQFLKKRLDRVRKLLEFLRLHRHELFDDACQAKLDGLYRNTGSGKTPIAPAQLAMASLLQGYVGASDAEAVELTVVNLRWQMVLVGCLGAVEPAFSQGALHDFRHRLNRADLDRRLLERTVDLARRTGGFESQKLPKSLRVATDSPPLEGVGHGQEDPTDSDGSSGPAVTMAPTLRGTARARWPDSSGPAWLKSHYPSETTFDSIGHHNDTIQSNKLCSRPTTACWLLDDLDVRRIGQRRKSTDGQRHVSRYHHQR